MGWVSPPVPIELGFFISLGLGLGLGLGGQGLGLGLDNRWTWNSTEILSYISRFDSWQTQDQIGQICCHVRTENVYNVCLRWWKVLWGMKGEGETWDMSIKYNNLKTKFSPTLSASLWTWGPHWQSFWFSVWRISVFQKTQLTASGAEVRNLINKVANNLSLHCQTSFICVCNWCFTLLHCVLISYVSIKRKE